MPDYVLVHTGIISISWPLRPELDDPDRYGDIYKECHRSRNQPNPYDSIFI